MYFEQKLDYSYSKGVSAEFAVDIQNLKHVVALNYQCIESQPYSKEELE